MVHLVQSASLDLAAHIFWLLLQLLPGEAVFGKAGQSGCGCRLLTVDSSWLWGVRGRYTAHGKEINNIFWLFTQDCQEAHTEESKMCSLHHQDSSRLDRLNPPRNALSALQAMLSDSELRDQCERTLGQQPGHLPMQPGSMSFVPSQAFATEYEKLEREILFHLGTTTRDWGRHRAKLPNNHPKHHWVAAHCQSKETNWARAEHPPDPATQALLKIPAGFLMVIFPLSKHLIEHIPERYASLISWIPVAFHPLPTALSLAWKV